MLMYLKALLITHPDYASVHDLSIHIFWLADRVGALALVQFPQPSHLFLIILNDAEYLRGLLIGLDPTQLM
jgi:hypothetical protein